MQLFISIISDRDLYSAAKKEQNPAIFPCGGYHQKNDGNIASPN